MHPFSTPWKNQKPYDFLIFSWGRERVHWKQMSLFFRLYHKLNSYISVFLVLWPIKQNMNVSFSIQFWLQILHVHRSFSVFHTILLLTSYLSLRIFPILLNQWTRMYSLHCRWSLKNIFVRNNQLPFFSQKLMFNFIVLS